MGVSEFLDTLRAKLASGALPRDPFVKTRIGPGSGRRCDACELLISTLEREVQGDLPTGDTLRFHLVCHDIWWRQERERPAEDRPAA
jgi:hypothetical protein